MSYSFDDLVAHERRRWMQPWAIEMMSPAERRADFDRWRDRLLHPDAACGIIMRPMRSART